MGRSLGASAFLPGLLLTSGEERWWEKLAGAQQQVLLEEPVAEPASHVCCCHSLAGCSGVPRAWASGVFCPRAVFLVAPEGPPAAKGPGAGQALATTAAAVASLMKPSHLMRVTYYNSNCD